MKNLLRLTGPLLSWLISFSTHAAIESNAVNLPANNKVLFLMGQDTTTLRAYKTEVLTNPVHSSLPKPGGVTLYVSVLPKATHTNSAPANATMYVSGIEGPPVDNNNGEVNFAETLSDYDLLANNNKVALAVGLYLSDEWASCGNQPLRAIAGTGDADVGSASDSASLTYQWRYAMDRMINYFKASGRPVYLRIGYEFDGPWNCYNQTFYKDAYRWIATRIDQLGATNVATVWQAATYPDDGDSAYGYQVSPNPAAHYESWYPGDAYVDWIGISFFAGSNYLTYQWSCQDGSKPWTVPDTTPRTLQNALMTFARNHSKPAMIAESAPQAFDLRYLNYSCAAARQNTQNFSSGQAAWNAFFSDYFQWIYDNRDNLRAVAYINTDWQSQNRWYCAPGSASCAAGYWGITSIQANTQVMNNFKTEMAKTFYAHAGDAIGGGNSSSGVASSSSSIASSAPASSTSSVASSKASSLKASSSKASSVASSSASSIANTCGDFGIAYSNNTTMVLYHKNNGWSASWNYLCLNGDCRAGTLTNGYYRRSVSGVLGQSYSIEFKVQQTAAPGQYLTGQQIKTFNNQCVLP